ncbi:hypothetical protein ACSSWA_11265 [Melioribacter sp. Ez-97]|uniref:hypothetical protein n=1 Tax=Melioribacter sp. Ez-97 TaxID=3423434 RepID=UPI003ED987C8
MPVKTICMHGSPLSKWDNKKVWEKYDYKEFGIIGEPYFDINWKEVLYLTDTGRRWNGNNVNIRDKGNSKFKFNFKLTEDIIQNLEKLPDKVMINVHPERWNNNVLRWFQQFVSQNIKNIIKRLYN